MFASVLCFPFTSTSSGYEEKFFCVIVADGIVDVLIVGLLRSNISDGERKGMLVDEGHPGGDGGFRGCQSTR